MYINLLLSKCMCVCACLCVCVCVCVCVRVCTVAAKWSLYLPPTFSLSRSLLRCLSLLSPHYKKHLHLISPCSPSHLSSPLLFSPLSPHLLPWFSSLSIPSPPLPLYLSLTHYPTAWSNQSAICEWKLPPHTVSLYYIVFALNFALNRWLFPFFFNTQTN